MFFVVAFRKSLRLIIPSFADYCVGDEIKAGGQDGFGKGVSSLVTNVVGGTAFALGKCIASRHIPVPVDSLQLLLVSNVPIEFTIPVFPLFLQARSLVGWRTHLIH